MEIKNTIKILFLCCIIFGCKSHLSKEDSNVGSEKDEIITYGDSILDEIILSTKYDTIFDSKFCEIEKINITINHKVFTRHLFLNYNNYRSDCGYFRISKSIFGYTKIYTTYYEDISKSFNSKDKLFIREGCNEGCTFNFLASGLFFDNATFMNTKYSKEIYNMTCIDDIYTEMPYIYAFGFSFPYNIHYFTIKDNAYNKYVTYYPKNSEYWE